jgi:hypothetical protein
MNFELINGSWQQTLATILYNIEVKLNDNEIGDIIRRIDATISDEEILELLGIVLQKITSLKTDNIDIKNDILLLSSVVSNILMNIISLKSDFSSVMNRVNSLSIVNKVTVVEKPIVKERFVRQRECRVVTPPVKKIEDVTFLMDMELRAGHSDGYKIYLPYGYTYDSRFSWLISGNKRRLLHVGELTDDMLEIYKSYNITDIEVIKKSRLNTYVNNRTKQRT